jgi:hypothetical protein
MTKIDIEAMRQQIENAIVESSVEGHTDLNDLTNKLLDLFLVSESYIKCWNCKQFEQTGTNTMGNEVGNCKLNDCKVSHPKWQKCGEYEQCGNFR